MKLLQLFSIDEIRKSRALRYYGIALSLTHFLTNYFWQHSFFTAFNDPLGLVCWPYFSSCNDLLVILSGNQVAVSAIYLLSSVAAFLLFCFPAKVELAWFALLITTSTKFMILSLDYRFMGNYHYMAFIVSFAYLFLPFREKVIPILITGFYVSAGTLKFNAEWLTGATLLRPLPFAEPFKSLALAFAIPLEVVGAWFLLAQSRFLFSLTFLFFLLFHAISWPVVGYFYPLTMLLLLSLFILKRLFMHVPRQSLLVEFFTLKSPKLVYFVAGLFVLGQAVPYFKKGDPALTGEGRLFSLNMLDAKSVCQNYIFAHFKNRIEEISENQFDMAVRVHCDPIVFFNLAKKACSSLKSDSSFVRLSVHLLSRRMTDRAWTKVIEENDFCQDRIQYSILPRNTWIKSEKQPDPTPEQELPIWPVPIQLKPLVDSAPIGPEVNFRGGVDRLGFVLSDKFTPQELRPWLRLPNGNSGVHGASKSSPAVDASGIYIGSDSGWFFAYNWNGDLKWKVFVGDSIRGIHGTASLDGKFVYFGGYNGRVYKVDKHTGSLIWVVQVGDALGASPVLYGDSLYISVETTQPNGYLVRIDRQSGKVIWASRALGEQSHSSPTLATDLQMVAAGDNAAYVRAFEMETGEQIWATKMAGDIKTTLPYWKGLFFVSGFDRQLNALNAQTGEHIWTYHLKATTRSSPTLWPEIDAVVLSDDSGLVHAVSIKTGKSLWTYQGQPDVNNPASAQVVRGIGRSFAVLPCTDKSICIFDTHGKVVRQVPSQAKVTSSPVIFEDKLLFSEDYPGDLVVFSAHLPE